MTSELRVDNLKGSTTGGSINVLGEGTSATTNLQQGLAKVWVQFDGTASGAASRDSTKERGEKLINYIAPIQWYSLFNPAGRPRPI